MLILSVSAFALEVLGECVVYVPGFFILMSETFTNHTDAYYTVSRNWEGSKIILQFFVVERCFLSG